MYQPPSTVGDRGLSQAKRLGSHGWSASTAKGKPTTAVSPIGETDSESPPSQSGSQITATPSINISEARDRSLLRTELSAVDQEKRLIKESIQNGRDDLKRRASKGSMEIAGPAAQEKLIKAIEGDRKPPGW
jgi:hypothetical protein